MSEIIEGVWMADFELAHLRNDAREGRKVLRRKGLRYYAVGLLASLVAIIAALIIIGTTVTPAHAAGSSIGPTINAPGNVHAYPSCADLDPRHGPCVKVTGSARYLVAIVYGRTVTVRLDPGKVGTGERVGATRYYVVKQ